MSENYTPRLKTRYREEIRKTLNDEFNYDNVMQIPGAPRLSSTWALAKPHVTPRSSTAHSRT